MHWIHNSNLAAWQYGKNYDDGFVATFVITDSLINQVDRGTVEKILKMNTVPPLPNDAYGYGE